ncbi:3-dehydroquinate synthase [hydrothermal vent metagenome]|uniref:3-dehydroquinate synthase n=1 Tax=hydrothermal vent metagenome TaxID=652676 RepID=A0A3B1DX31_9ZZZZ
MPDSAESLAVQVFLGDRSYDVNVESNVLVAFVDYLETWLEELPEVARSAKKAFVVTDKNVQPLHAVHVLSALQKRGWKAEQFVISPGETSKSLDVISQMYDRLIAMQADRFTIVIAVGGGVVGDAAGFAAATFARGIPFVQVPTTLLAQVDSSVGGKVGINHPQGKNLIGAFHQPLGVLVDTSTLQTLPERDYRSGLAEVVKYGVIFDADFFEYLEQNIEGLNNRTPQVMRFIVAASCRFKADVVEQDEHETTGLRACLNYGHTFAHAFENLSGYGELLHGEAVAIGMIYASKLAEKLEYISSDVTQRQQNLLEALSLPTSLPEGLSLSTDNILTSMQRDKKTVGGKLRFVLPTELGKVKLFDNIPKKTVRDVIDSLL